MSFVFPAIGSEERKLIVFLLKLFLIWVSWKVILYVLGEEGIPLDKRFFPQISYYWEAFNTFLAHIVLGVSKVLLEWMGYVIHWNDRVVRVEGTGGVGMGNYCIGIQLMYYYSMLLLVTPSLTSRQKLWGALAGIGITFFLNIVRITVMCLVVLYMPEYIDYFHDHVFNVVVFGSMMLHYYFLIRKQWMKSPAARS